MTEPVKLCISCCLLIFIFKSGDKINAPLMSAALKFGGKKYLHKLKSRALADNSVAHT